MRLSSLWSSSLSVSMPSSLPSISECFSVAMMFAVDSSCSLLQLHCRSLPSVCFLCDSSARLASKWLWSSHATREYLENVLLRCSSFADLLLNSLQTTCCARKASAFDMAACYSLAWQVYALSCRSSSSSSVRKSGRGRAMPRKKVPLLQSQSQRQERGT